MPRLLTLLLSFLVLWAAPALSGGEQETKPETVLSAEDKEIVEMLEILELMEILRDMDVLAAMEDEQ